MTTANRDPLTIAHEVLDDERAWAALDPGHHPESQAAVYRLANAAPTLARAVIDLTAKLDAERFAHANTAVKVKGVEALADRLSAEAADDFDGVSGTSVSLVKYETAKAIRAALNGETND